MEIKLYVYYLDGSLVEFDRVFRGLLALDTDVRKVSSVVARNFALILGVRWSWVVGEGK